ncbi:PHA/PHB synthase family protein [Spirillospora sp. NPDC050679]
MRHGPDAAASAAVPVAPGDRRFTDPAWTTSLYFHSIQQTYLLNSRLVLEWVDALPANGNDARVLRALAQLAIDAAAPTNFLAANPEALRAALHTRGRSLLRGSANFLSDLRTHRGMPAAVDASGFVKGRDLAATPGRVVFRNRLMELIQYQPQTETVHSVPMLLSPPWVNKYYGADLAPGRSLLEWLVQHGHTTFVISYRNPDPTLRDVGFEQYLQEGLLDALKAVHDITGSPEANLVGVCLGGTLALMLAAWLPADHTPRVRSLTLLNTMVDFAHVTDAATGGWSGRLFQGPLIDLMDLAASRRGYVGGRGIDAFFRFLRANDLVWRYVSANWLMGRTPPAFDVLAWNSDLMNVPHRAQRYLLRDLCIGNGLVNGTAELAGRPLCLDDVRQDVFMVSARNDHIIPWEAAHRTIGRLGGDVRFLLVSGGHVAGVIAPPHPKQRYWTADGPPQADPQAWSAATTEHRDTWWRPWATWLAERSGPQRTPPPTGSARHPAREPAPGTYIHT